jgi:site-specific DNA recombinase
VTRRVGVYARVSKAEAKRRDETSIPVQLADCRLRAESEEGWEIVDTYEDTGISAWNPRRKRPAFERLLADVEAGKVDTVLVREQERLLRQLGDTKRIQDLAEAGKLRLIACTMESDINFARARDRDDFRKRASQAQFYSDFLSEKVRATKAAQASNGEYTGGEKEPFGYKRSRNGKLEIDPTEKAVLLDAVARLGRGQPVTRIIREWNAAGLRSSRGARWSPRTLARTLTLGHLTGERGYPRVLSDEEAAIARAALGSRPREPGRPIGVRAPLSGFLRCADCGTKLSSAAGFYRCPLGHGGCGSVSIKSLPLERYVLLESLKRWIDVGDRTPDEKLPERDTAPLLAELRKLEKRAADISDGLASGVLSVQVAGEASQRVEARRREATEMLSRAVKPAKTEPTIRSLVEVFPPEELVEAGLGRYVRERDRDASHPFRAKWEARDSEAVAQVRSMYTEVLDHAVITQRRQRGRAFEPERVRITWKP